MDPLWWVVGIAVLAVVVVMVMRSLRVRMQPPPEDTVAERAAHEQARLDHEKRGQSGPGAGSV